MEQLLTNHSLLVSFLCSWTGTDWLHGVSWHAIAFKLFHGSQDNFLTSQWLWEDGHYFTLHISVFSWDLRGVERWRMMALFISHKLGFSGISYEKSISKNPNFKRYVKFCLFHNLHISKNRSSVWKSGIENLFIFILLHQQFGDLANRVGNKAGSLEEALTAKFAFLKTLLNAEIKNNFALYFECEKLGDHK